MGDRGAIWLGLTGRRIDCVLCACVFGRGYRHTRWHGWIWHWLAGVKCIRTGCCDRRSNKIKVVKPLEQTHLNIHNTFISVLWPRAKEERTNNYHAHRVCSNTCCLSLFFEQRRVHTKALIAARGCFMAGN